MHVRVFVSTECTFRPFQLEFKGVYFDSISAHCVGELISNLQTALKQYGCVQGKEELILEALKQYECVPEKEELRLEALKQYERVLEE